jgi:hypothetical protein
MNINWYEINSQGHDAVATRMQEADEYRLAQQAQTHRSAGGGSVVLAQAAQFWAQLLARISVGRRQPDAR